MALLISCFPELDAANMALQNKLDLVERKAQMQETALKRLNRERDMAVSQLGVAYLESQDLKNENENLRQENADLSAQLTKLTSLAKTREDTYRSERTSASDLSSDDSQIDTQRSMSGSQGTKDVTSKSTRTRAKAGKREDSRAKISTQVDREISRLEKERADEALFSIDMPRTRESSKPKAEKAKAKKQPNTGKQRVKRVVVEEVDVTEPVESTGEVTNNTRKSSATEPDTLLSFVDVSSQCSAISESNLHDTYSVAGTRDRSTT